MADKKYRCYKCKKLQRTEKYEAVYCCGSLTTWKWIEGSVSEARKCDIRCTSAKGHKCNCQCGGKNHASDWSQIGRPINELLAAA